MSARRTLATAVASAALLLAGSAPAAGVLVPDPGPHVPPRPSVPSAPSGASTADEPQATPTDRPLAGAVDPANVLAHLQAWQTIADRHDGTRAAGTAGHEASARYVEERLTAAGYDTWRHTFPFTYERTRSTSVTATVGATTTSVGHLPMAQSPGTPDGGVTGPLALPSGAATGCTPQDWEGVETAGRIALLTRGGCTFADKARVAGEAGAVGLVVHNTTTGPLNGALGGHPDEHIPTVGVTEEVGRDLRELSADATLSIALDKVVEERETFSVLAETGTGDADGTVMVGAHLDSGRDGPGINDNGTGSAVLLETAVRLAEAGTPERPVRFAWWGASDLGNLGSRAYVSDLAAGPDGLGGLALYLDVDTVASPNHIIGVHGTGDAGSALTDSLDSVGQAWVETATPEDSDARSFLDEGVPTAGLSTGTSGAKTVRESELFGGRAGVPHDPNNDTVADDLDNVDVDVLETTTEVVARAVETLASR